MRSARKLIVLILVAALLLSGCNFSETFEKFAAYYGTAIPFEQMEYTRPDMDALEASVDACLQAVASGEPIEAIMDTVYDFYNHYDNFSTNQSLAYLHYN